ncbi:MAG TPA: diphosphate--fructose-6-phosphate 1-phosphotransferase, partial [Thermomicrobiales bacterium]|nr:diphosphate--fructose-6-phosphate 1-phosphotransferase [Thermomicrobiales bacterium]
EVLDGLRRTPSSALGTGRYKLKDGDLDRALDLLSAHNITAMVYIGGNDSADTAHRLAERARERKQNLQVISVPKTVDNDLPETDHCPGYPSMARYLANTVRDATYDTLAAPHLYPVKFIEVMGRDAGWVAAAGALGFTETERAADLAPRILFPERPPESAGVVLDAVRADLARRGWTVVVVPETLHAAGGAHLGGAEPDYVDEFGHPYYPSTGAALARLVTQHLGVRARFEKPGSAARMSISLVSEVDLDEAYRLGGAAVERILAGETARMTALRRIANDPYATTIASVPVELIANRVRHLPDEFIHAGDMDITDAFREWATPLLGARPFPPYARIGQ